MFNQRFTLDVKGRDDRVYNFNCDPKSPLGEIHDALYTMQGVVLSQMQEQLKKQRNEAQKHDGQEECPNECEKQEGNE